VLEELPVKSKQGEVADKEKQETKGDKSTVKKRTRDVE